MRLYLSLDSFAETALGDYWVSTASKQPTQIIRALVRASAHADTLVRGRLGKPGATTTTANMNIGDRIVPVASCINLKPGDVLDFGNERLTIDGVRPVYAAYPFYPGTVTFTRPATVGHVSGTPVRGLLQERWRARGGATNAAEYAGPPTQEMEMALAHAPQSGVNDNVTEVFLGAAPVTELVRIALVYRWSATPVDAPLTNVQLNERQGHYRLQLGMFSPQGTDIETTYVGGWDTVPEDVEEAVSLLAAQELSRGIAAQAQGLTLIKTSTQTVQTRASTVAGSMSGLAADARLLLAPYVRLV